MNSHLITIVVLLLALACHVAGLSGVGLVLFFLAAALEIALWLHAVQLPRRASPRLLARLNTRR
jgi:hypothetical protein